MMRLKIRARQTNSFRIRSRQMRSIVRQEIVLDSFISDHLRQSILAEREDVVRSVRLFLVESASLDADGVDEEGSE